MPLTLAINAPWGVGKSTLGLMVRRRLEGKPAANGSAPHVTFWFEAWLHDEAENLATAFIAELARTLDSHRSRWRRFFNPLSPRLLTRRQRLSRRMMLGGLAVLFSLAVALYISFGGPGVREALLKLLKLDKTVMAGDVSFTGAVFSLSFVTLAFLKHIQEIARAVGHFVASPKTEAGGGSIADVRNELGRLIDQGVSRGSRLVIFVDDLERCRPPGSVNLLEIVNQLLRRVPPMPVVTVIMGDLDSIAADAEEKYKSKAERYQKERADSGISQGSDRGFGSNFLQKIIQLQFDLPDPPPDKVQTLVHQSVGEDEKDEGSETEGRSDLFERVVEAGHRLGDSLVMIFVGWLKAAWEADGGTGVLIRRLWHSRVGMADIFNLVSLIFLPFVWIARFCFDIAFPISRRRNVNWRPRVLSFRELKLFRPQSGLEFGARFKKNLYQNAFIWSWVLLLVLLIEPPFLLLGLLSYPYDFVVITPIGIEEVLLVHLRLIFLGLVSFPFVAFLYGAVRRLEFERDVQIRRERAHALVEEKGIDFIPQSSVGGGEDDESDIFFEEQRQLFLTNDSQAFRYARDQALQFLRLRPRSIKRLINHLRLLISILAHRGLLGEEKDGKIDPRQVGKWAALQERWPRLAGAVVDLPELMQRLENAVAINVSREDGLANIRDLIREASVPISTDDSLREFLKAPPTLGKVAKRLVYLHPEETVQDAGETAEAS